MNKPVTEFNVGQFVLSEDDCIERGIDFSAYEKGVSDAADAFSRNRAVTQAPAPAPVDQQAQLTAEEMRPHFEWWYTTRGIFPPLGSKESAAAWSAWLASGGYTAPEGWQVSPMSSWSWDWKADQQAQADLYERIAAAHDASLDDDHRACRDILRECMSLLASPPQAQPEQQAQAAEPVESKASGSFMTREQAIEHCRKRRPGIEPTEQHIAATIDAYSALFGDLVPAASSPEGHAAWVVRKPGGYSDVGYESWRLNKLEHGTKLYTAPPVREPLKPAQIVAMRRSYDDGTGNPPESWSYTRGVRDAERAHGIGGKA